MKCRVSHVDITHGHEAISESYFQVALPDCLEEKTTTCIYLLSVLESNSFDQ
jgi:hypothetical protein